MPATAIRLGFAGAGRMAQAIGRGIAGNRGLVAEPACFFDPEDAAAVEFESGHPHARRLKSLRELAENCHFLILAVKPQVMPGVLKELQPVVNQDHLIVSVAAGVSMETLRNSLASDRMIRAMPNTPCLIGQGVTALAYSDGASEPDRALTQEMFGLVGKVVVVPESLMDAVTGLSGSGPAYVFSFVEALIQGGVAAGLPEEMAAQLALQTTGGAVALMLESGKSPDELRRNVSSPGGTTLAGLAELERGNLGQTIQDAIAAATRRAAELARESAAVR